MNHISLEICNNIALKPDHTFFQFNLLKKPEGWWNESVTDHQYLWRIRTTLRPFQTLASSCWVHPSLCLALDSEWQKLLRGISHVAQIWTSSPPPYVLTLAGFRMDWQNNDREACSCKVYLLQLEVKHSWKLLSSSESGSQEFRPRSANLLFVSPFLFVLYMIFMEQCTHATL